MREHLDAARHLPAHYYTSADILEKEYEKIFLREWLYVAREEEVPNPGDFIAMTIARQPLIVCRDRAGKLQVLLNVCRHRGTRVTSGCGNASVFSCPYHAWTYNLDGTLRAAPFTDNIENFSKPDWSLRPVTYVVWGGFIFVNFSPEPTDFATFIGDCPEVYAPYQFERQKLGLNSRSNTRATGNLRLKTWSIPITRPLFTAVLLASTSRSIPISSIPSKAAITAGSPAVR